MRFRTPSTSPMMRATSEPVLLASKYDTDSRDTCAWTRLRNSAIRRWPSFDSSCVRANDEAPWINVATTTTTTSGSSSSGWRPRVSDPDPNQWCSGAQA